MVFNVVLGLAILVCRTVTAILGINGAVTLNPRVTRTEVGSSLASPGWKVGTQYTYEVRGRVVTGIFQALNQYSGINTRAKLSVQPKSENTLSLQVHGAQYAEIHANLSDGWSSEIADGELKYMALPIQNTPWEIQLQNGVVKGIVVDKDLPTWEINILKSITSLLQVDTQGENVKKSSSNIIPSNEEPSGVFKTMEDSIHGEYETIYEVSELPEYIMLSRPEIAPLPHLKGNGKIINIVKNRNFSRSDKHIVYNYGMEGKTKWEPGSNHMGNFLSRSSISRIVLTGNIQRYVIQSSITDEKIVLAPHLHDTKKGLVASRMNLTLEGVNPAQGPSPSVINPKTINSLAYEYKAVSERQQGGDDSDPDSSSSSSSNSENNKMNAPLKKRVQGIQNSQESREFLSMGKYHHNSESSSSSSSSSESSSSSSESSESLSSSEEYYHAQSQLHQAPQADLLPYYTGYKGQSIHNVKEFNPVENAIKIAQEIAHGIQHPETITGESTLFKFDTLTRILRTMSLEQYNKVVETIYVSYPRDHHSKQMSKDYLAWVSLRDAIAEAGTGPALLTIKDWIKSKKVRGEEAAQLVAVLPYSARYPTKEYITSYFEIVNDNDVQKEMFLNTSAVLSFTELVRKSMVDRRNEHNYYPVHMFGPLSGKDESSLEQYIKYFENKLKEAVDHGDSIKIQVYIQALGNIAHCRVLSSFEPYLEGQKSVSKFQRLVMVAAMSRMTQVYPEQAQAVLYRIYQNIGESPEVRTAAVMQIMKTNPSAQMLQRMAQQTNYDHSKQVNAAVKSAIESIANQAVNKYNKLSVANAKSAVNLLTPENFGVHNSRNFIKSFVVKEQNLGYKHQVSHIQSPDSILPRSIFYSLSRSIGGYKRSTHEMHYMTSSVDQLIEQLSQCITSSSSEAYRQKKGSSTQWSLKQIYESLGFENEGADQLEGNILVTTLGVKRYLAFDNHTVEQLPKIIQMISTTLQNGKNFNWTKLYNQFSMELAFSTAAGFPFTYTLTVPTVVSLGGKISLSQGKDNINERMKGPQMTNITGSYNYIYSSKRQGKMGFITPFNARSYVSGFEKNLQIHLPLYASTGVDMKNKKMEVLLKPLENEKRQKLFEYSSDVYTASENILDMIPLKENKDTCFIRTKKPTSYGKSVGHDSLGFALDINMEGVQVPSNIQKAYEIIRNYDLFSLWLYSDMDDQLNSRNITVIHSPNRSWANTARLSIQYSSQKSGQIKKQEKSSHNKHSKEQYQALNSENSALLSSSESGERRNEILGNTVSGIVEAEGHAFDISMSLEGQKKAEVALVVAYASSPVSENSRLLVYFGNYTGEQKSRSLEVGLQVNMKSPRVPIVNYHDALNADPKTEVNGRVDFRGKPLQGGFLSFKGELEATPERRKYLRQHPLSILCEKQMQNNQYMQPACRNMTARANYLDSYHFTISYQNLPPSIKNVTYMTYAAARYLGYPYNQENTLSENSKEGQIDVQVNFGKSLRKVNVSLTSPALSSKFEQVPIHEWLRPILVIHPHYGALERLGQRIFLSQQSPICVLDGGAINTFDNRSYEVNLGDAPHVLAQSIFNNEQLRQLNMIEQNRNYFSIIARQYSENKLAITVIAGDDTLEIQPNGEKSANFLLNGEHVSVKEGSVTKLSNEEGKEIVQVNNQPQGAYQISSKNYGFELIWSGNSIRIQVANGFRGKIRGLCGNLDGESYNDFLTPGGYIVNNTQVFTSSYAIGQSDKEIRGDKQIEYGVREEIMLGDIISENDYGKLRKIKSFQMTHSDMRDNAEIDDNLETAYRVKIIKEHGKTCFSLKPQLSCGSSAKANKLVEKTIEFHCIENSSASKHWEAMVKKGANPDFTQKGSNHRATLKIPQKCIEK